MSIVEKALEALSITAPDLIKELVVKPIEDSGIDKVIHISNNHDIPLFIPIVPIRAGDGEDLRIPRICTASSITGCIIGYNGIISDFYNTEEGFKCQYVIYSFKPPVVIKPSNKLLPPVEITGERWIIPHEGHTEYVPDKIAMLTVVGVSSRPTSVNGNVVIEDNIECVLSVYEGHNVKWTAGKEPLETGYYSIIANKLPNWGFYNENVNYLDYGNTGNTVIKNITKAEYDELLLNVSLLSHQEKPRYLYWD